MKRYLIWANLPWFSYQRLSIFVYLHTWIISGPNHDQIRPDIRSWSNQIMIKLCKFEDQFRSYTCTNLPDPPDKMLIQDQIRAKSRSDYDESRNRSVPDTKSWSNHISGTCTDPPIFAPAHRWHRAARSTRSEPCSGVQWPAQPPNTIPGSAHCASDATGRTNSPPPLASKSATGRWGPAAWGQTTCWTLPGQAWYLKKKCNAVVKKSIDDVWFLISLIRVWSNLYQDQSMI